MYLDFETYANSPFADASMDEASYRRASALADATIDEITLGRVGETVANGETLPPQVVSLYSALATNARKTADSIAKGEGSEAALSSFSNGVDSYSFDTDSDEHTRLMESVSPLVDALPVGWVSACVGGSRRRCHWGCCCNHGYC